MYNNSDIELWCDKRSKPHTTNDNKIVTVTTCTNHGNHNFSDRHDNNNDILVNNRIYVNVGNSNADYINSYAIHFTDNKNILATKITTPTVRQVIEVW